MRKSWAPPTIVKRIAPLKSTMPLAGIDTFNQPDLFVRDQFKVGCSCSTTSQEQGIAKGRHGMRRRDRRVRIGAIGPLMAQQFTRRTVVLPHLVEPRYIDRLAIGAVA